MELTRGIRNQLTALVAGLSAQDLRPMSLGLSHSLSRYKLKFSPDKVDTMIVQVTRGPGRLKALQGKPVCATSETAALHTAHGRGDGLARLRAACVLAARRRRAAPEPCWLASSPHAPPPPLAQAIGLLDDLDKELNTYAMRVREWYGWHFPEMTKIVTDNIAYAKTGGWRRAAPGGPAPAGAEAAQPGAGRSMQLVRELLAMPASSPPLPLVQLYSAPVLTPALPLPLQSS